MSKIERDKRFTVLMPVHNRADIFLLFEKAIHSVFENTVIPDELVLIVDGPLEERFKEKIHALAKIYPIRVIWLLENSGITNALNTGLATIHTKWIMRADADDINLPNRFELQIRILEAGYDLVGGAIEEVDYSGELLATKLVPLQEEAIRRFIKFRNPFNHMTVAFLTETAKRVGGYPEIPLKEDYALWASFLKQGAKVVNLQNILVRATTGKAMYARRGSWKGVISEISLQRHLHACGLQSILGAIGIASLRVIVLMLPSSTLSVFYRFFLRRS